MTATTPPDLSNPIIDEPAQTSPGVSDQLGPLEHLVGTWTNQDLIGGKGGRTSPFSYNLMVLPQYTGAPDYILKNFTYYEEITFSTIHGTAPNRGGTGVQVANTLFYEQRVYFADGPAKDQLVHAENGSWLYLTDTTQQVGPYNDGGEVPGSTAPTQPFDVIKQMSVPHGNSILAAGSASAGTGVPSIAAPDPILPTGVDTSPYTTESVGNPLPALNENPNQPLVDATTVAPPTSWIELAVDTTNGGHPVTNIGFEQSHAKVTDYSATYWLESLAPDGAPPAYDQLQYTQSIIMQIPIPGHGTVAFPHITCNTLRRA